MHSSNPPMIAPCSGRSGPWNSAASFSRSPSGVNQGLRPKATPVVIRCVGPEQPTEIGSRPPVEKTDGGKPPVAAERDEPVSARYNGPMSNVTRILSAIDQGDPHAAEQLLPLVYEELRKL